METIYLTKRTRQQIREEHWDIAKIVLLCLFGFILTLLAIWVAIVVIFCL